MTTDVRPTVRKAGAVSTTVHDHGIGSWPMRRARISPHRTALVGPDEELDYATLAARVEHLATTLRTLGIGRGDRVAYLGPNAISTFECLFASGRRGAIFVPLNTRLAGSEIAYMLRDSGARLLVYGPECAATVAEADPESLGVQHVLSVDELRALVRSTPAEPDDPANHTTRIELDDPALILYTSGTTGRPKGAVLSHGNITWNTVNQLAHVDLASTDVTICAAPLFHVTGLGQITMPTFFKGGTVVVVPKFDPGPFLELLEQRRATGFAAVPTMLQMICDHPDWERRDVSSLRYVVFGGSPVLARVAEKWLARGVQVQQGYGLTEAAPGILMAVPEGIADHPVSAGVPHFFTDTTLETPLRERIDGPGQGELLVRGPHVFTGYWDRPGDTAEAMSADGWLRTGDVVRVDEDGWAQVVDRVKDMIISGGENIYPAEVEAVIAELPGVDLVAVVAKPDERWGEVGHAFVVLAEGATLDEAALRQHLDGRLARYKIPQGVEFVADLPRTATGKILRAPLRERARTSPPKGHA